MIKIIKIPSIRLLKITLFFTFFLWIFIALYAFLSHGIHLERFSILNAQVDGFYLRLDKKLILNINSLDLKRLKSESNGDFNIKMQTQIAKNVHFILQYFQSIEIKNIFFKDYRASIFYDGDDFTLNLPNIYAKINLQERASKVHLKVHHFYLKPLGAYYEGSGIYDLRAQRIFLDGNLSILNRETYVPYFSMSLNAKSDLKTLELKGASKAFSDIRFLRPILPKIQNPLVDAWIFNNYSIESAIIRDFYLKIPLSGKDILKKSIQSLHIIADVQNADVIFHPNLPPAHSPLVKLIFQNNALEFHPTNPTFKEHNANGTSVILKDLISQNPTLELNLRTNSTLNDDILEVLNAYAISLPLSAPNTKINTHLNIQTNLKTLKTEAKGIFSASNSQVLLAKIPLDSKELKVELDNHLIKVNTQNTTFKEILNADSNFLINLETKELSGEILAHNLELMNKNILTLSNKNLPFLVDFKDNIQITLPTLKFNANLGEMNYFNFNALSEIVPYSKILQDYKIQNGNMKLSTSDFVHYKAEANAKSAQKILLNKDNKPISSINLNIDYSPEALKIESSDKRLIFVDNLEYQKLNLEQLNIALLIDDLPKSEISENKVPFLIQGKNANIFYNDFEFLSNSFNINLVDDSIKAQLQYKNGKLDFYKHKDSITLDAREFGDEFLNTITKQDTFKKGRFFLNINTNAKGILEGEAKLISTSVNKLGILQNLLAFIDTIPSLLRLKAPGFNQDGYFIENGIIKFALNKEYLAISDLNLNGSTLDLKGKGVMHLEAKNLDFHAELIFAKSLSKIINKIPLVNYILLGKDGTISTNVKIAGTLNEPEITTQTAQDIILMPFNIIKRTITSPLEIFN